MSNHGTTGALARVEEQPKQIVDAEWEGLRMVVSPAEALRRVQELQAFVSAVMKSEVDYGTIPGTQKPTLYQPGAQKLCEMYGLAWTYEDVERVEDWPNGFFFYRKRCVLTSRRDGRYVGDGLGSCNAREDRYGWRWVLSDAVPPGMDKKTLACERKTKWFFDSNLPEGTDKSKCRTKTIPTKRGQAVQYAVDVEQFRIPNPDIYSLVNTIEKMACKRALIHAVLGATRSAGLFTQDLEDLPPEVFGKADDSRSWEEDESGVPTEAQEKRFADLVIELNAVDTTKKLREFGAHSKAARDNGEITQEQAAELLRRYTEKDEKAKAARAAATTEKKPEAPQPATTKPAKETPASAAAAPATTSAPDVAEHDSPPPEDEPGSNG